MLDLIIGIVATIASTIIIGLFGLLIITPYKNHQEIFVKILRLIRNYEDPRSYIGQQLSHSFMVTCIESQANAIEDINELIEDQQELNPIYKIFKYHDVTRCLNVLFHYITDPISIEEEFSEGYKLDTQKLFVELKKRSRFPWMKFSLIILFLILMLIGILVMAFRFAVNTR